MAIIITSDPMNYIYCSNLSDNVNFDSGDGFVELDNGDLIFSPEKFERLEKNLRRNCSIISASISSGSYLDCLRYKGITKCWIGSNIDEIEKTIIITDDVLDNVLTMFLKKGIEVNDIDER